MITFSSAEINTWIAAFLWPLTRILGLIATAPLYGNLSVPTSVKIGLGVLLALIIAPNVPAVAAADPLSLTGFLILLQQLIIGLAMGFAMRVVFAGVEMAGEITGLTMGFGFATFFDPQTRGRSSAISQYMALIALMLFLATNMHLALLVTLSDSFVTLPVSGSPIGGEGLHEIASWGAKIFQSGLQLSMPIIAILLITNIALGVLTRAAPQLNLFGIGFPITLGTGFLMITLVLPLLVTPLGNLFQEGIEVIGRILAPSPGIIAR